MKNENHNWNNPDLSEPSIEEQEDTVEYLWQEEVKKAKKAITLEERVRAVKYGLAHLLPNIIKGDSSEEHY